MNLLPFIFRTRCHGCSKWRHPKEVLRLPGNVVICWTCYEWHLAALKLLAGQPPKGCQECGVTFRQLMERAPNGNISMYVHRRDGIYQILCPTCSDQYARKRLDLYGDTVSGWLRKLKGNK